MKKLFCILLTLSLIFALTACGEKNETGATSDPAKADEATITASIYIDGTYERACEKVTCKDLNGDGIVDLLEALEQMNSTFFVIHENETVSKYFSYETSDDIVTVTKFYGKEDVAWAFFINNAPATSVYDAVFDGAQINVFNYIDRTGYSDMYTYFEAVSSEGNSHTFKLLGYSYNESGELVEAPVAGALVPFENDDGEITDYTTDSNGLVTLEYPDGNYVLTASSEELIIVPPIYYTNPTN